MLKLICLVVGIIIIIATIASLISGFGIILPGICMFLIPAIFSIVGVGNAAEFFGVDYELIWQLCFGVFVGSGMLSIFGFEIISSVVTSAGLIELGILMTGLVPAEILEQATGILSIPFLASMAPLFIIVLFFVII